MYPHVNGVGGTNDPNYSKNTQGRSEQDPRDIDIFGGSSSYETTGNKTLDKLHRTRQSADEASQNTQSHMERVKYYISQGYTYAEAIEAAEAEGDGPANRENLVQKLVNQGYDRETAEKLIPKNIDERIDFAREKGRIEGEIKVKELDQNLDNLHNRRW